MTDTKKLEELFEAGVHLGHKSNRVHPLSKKYIYKFDSGTSIIDLTKTLVNLEKAKEFITKLATEKKSILFVATKKVASKIVEDHAVKNNLAYVTFKWPAGLLTNFETIDKNVKTLRQMQEDKETGAWNKLVKHERASLQKKLNRLNIHYGGLLPLNNIPDALFIVDIKKEKNAVNEAKKTNVPIIAIVDTNSNPNDVNLPIVGNDDSETSVRYLVDEIVETYLKGVNKK